MDTNAPKKPATLPFAAWQGLTPDAAAREVHQRVAALPHALRSAALAWLRPEAELAAELGNLRTVAQSTSTATTAARPHHLEGIPYLLKDLFDLAGVPTLAGSTFLPQVRPTPIRDSAIVSRLRELGAACAGKTHLVEFASGLTGENPHYGDCPHPLFPDRLSGGSSSGSAALVAAGVTPLAIGTDTGGSVRVPAAFCGLHGFRLRPHGPLISDAFPLAPSMDTAGWFTAGAADMLQSWQVMIHGRAKPPEDPSGSAQVENPREPQGCFLPMCALLPDADPETARASDEAAAAICQPADASTESHLIDAWRSAVDAYVTIGMSEAFSVHRDWLTPYQESYDPAIWSRFTAAGTFPTAQITGAREIQREVWSAWRQFFRNYDYLILPAVPCPAPRKAECTPELRRRILTLTAPASLGGLPVLSLPVPLSSGLSVGLQVIVPLSDSPVVPWLLKRST